MSRPAAFCAATTLRSNAGIRAMWRPLRRRAATVATPVFVDADLPSLKTPRRPTLPRAQSGPNGRVRGLTVIALFNSRLVYALTWFGLALMVVRGCGGLWHAMNRAALQPRRHPDLAHSLNPSSNPWAKPARPTPLPNCCMPPAHPAALDCRGGTAAHHQATHCSLNLPAFEQAMLSIVAGMVVFNIAPSALAHAQGVHDVELFIGLLIDVAALTAQLYLSGGIGNPSCSCTSADCGGGHAAARWLHLVHRGGGIGLRGAAGATQPACPWPPMCATAGPAPMCWACWCASCSMPFWWWCSSPASVITCAGAMRAWPPCASGRPKKTHRAHGAAGVGRCA